MALISIAITLAIIWLLAVIAFHVTVWLIHLALIIAVALVIVHIVRRIRARQ